MNIYHECKIKDAGQFFRTLRKSEQINQREMAKLAYLTNPVISAVESGRREPSIEWIRRVAGAMGYEVSLRLVKKINDLPEKK